MRLRLRGPVAGKGALGAAGQAFRLRANAGAHYTTLRPGRDTSDPRGRPRRRVARGKALLDSLVDSGFPGIVTRVTTRFPWPYLAPRDRPALDRFDASGVTSSPGPAIPRASRPMPTSAVTTPARPPRRRPHAPSAAPAITDRMRGTATLPSGLRRPGAWRGMNARWRVSRVCGMGILLLRNRAGIGLNGAILEMLSRRRRPGAQLASIDQPFQHDAIIRVALRLDDNGPSSPLQAGP